ncbi:efflux RND transporter periplasmic adaptor subunit [Megasphaera sueciensis]|uniref:efflux RND transporter periplasmic adaptor subunit n=1 Tax=Megasphaera sueciensis TaxID=349094 RepID=UPI003D021839
MNKNIKIGIAVIVTIGCIFGGYTYYETQEGAKKATAVETAEASRKNLKTIVSATGTIRPIDSVEVSAKITARIKSILVKENDSVTSGQTVAILDGKDYEAKRDQAQYKVTNTKIKLERAQRLYTLGAGTKSDLDDAQFNYDTAVSDLAEAESDVAETVITAPMSGIVVGEPKSSGTMAVQGTSNPTVIMNIADSTQKQIRAKVDETDIGNIRVGEDATFTVDAYTGKTFTARVSGISQTDVNNTWDTSSSSTSASSSSSSSASSSSSSVIYYYVTLDIDDPEDILRLGMTARVEITTAQKNNVLCIPIAALKTNDQGTYVLLVDKSGQTQQTPVTTGIYSGDDVEILGGLQEGEAVSIAYTAPAASSNKNQAGPPPM